MSHRAKLSSSLILTLTAIASGACSDINHPPVVVDQRVTTNEDVPVEIRVLDGAHDPDGDALTVTLATAVGHRVEIENGSVIALTPMQDFHGTIDVVYRVSDGHNPDVTGHVMVTVASVNDPPVATGGSRSIHGSDPVMLGGTDADGDALTYEVLAGPKHGTITGNPPALQYTPEAAFIGDDAVTYRVSDGMATSEPATLQLHVSPGAAPVAAAGEVRASEDTQLELTRSLR